ncbi:MAG: family 2 glycosyl transferase, partial [Glutamicibacter protophormiae]
MNTAPKPLGQLLVEQQLVTQSDVDRALEEQRREGGKLGRHLLLAGAVQRRDLYGALAEQWGTALVDLVEEPPQPDLLAGLDHEWALSSAWLPYRRQNGRTVIATSTAPTPAVLDEARKILGTPVDVVATTDWDIQQALHAS